MSVIDAWVAPAARQALTRQQVDLGPLGDEDVEIQVESCGLCHSDLSVWADDWGVTQYPAVLGHEAVGRVVDVGRAAKGIQVGQRVGVGWNAGSCMHCRPCLSGDQHLCAEVQATIVGRRGGFASRVRSHWAWTIPIPEGLPAGEAGPLLCGGITVFNPLALYALPTSRVGVVGIGGLGHMALKFAAAYGCDVTAFTSNPGKFEEARGFGAHHVVATRDSEEVRKLGRSLDLLLVTTNVPLDWDAMLSTLAPKGRMHVVGAVLEPIPVAVFPILFKQASVSASPTGPPVAIATMLEFAARHGVAPTTEHFPMSRINEALERLQAGKARYRIVLDADF
ncbi:NADPH-dependent aldehyde reductase Ahr [Paludisphaera mucosa]|uniref:NAD(P)-dependent alcohol dehydrogenase n=1 Tax=Paludisphaera mucosa TaxID=3030827 RepID=A0ABT6FK34_9BACT|nr:NAD(P)-dependent alcohol dehydrogenase [Paludisphaera mucosa]MDG3007856.1 NAD(P)-dependent alcohol dehydrogenase [Paludisphaera mucosa]